MDINQFDYFQRKKLQIESINTPFRQFQRQMESINAPFRRLQEQMKIANTPFRRFQEQMEIANTSFRRFHEQMEIANAPFRRFQEQMKIANTSFRRFHEQMEIANAPFQKFQRQMESINAPFRQLEQLIIAQTRYQRQALSRANQFRIPSITDASYLYRNVDGGIIQPKTWARDVLRKGLWTIDDESVIEYLANNLHTGTNPEEYICYYYSNNGWAKLATIVEGWAKCEAIRERYDALKEAFDIFRFTQEANINSERTTMNTLIMQIEGIRCDIADIILPDTRKDLEIDDDFIEHEYGVKTNLRNKITCSFISKHISHDYAITFHDVICHGVFLKTDKFEELMKKGNIPIKFNRHIMAHGYTGYSNYGTTENVIRAFLYLDFMIKIVTKLNDRTYH